MSAVENDCERIIQEWLDQVNVPEGYEKLTVKDVIKRREYGVSAWKDKVCEHLGQKEDGTLWSDFDVFPLLESETQKLDEIVTDRKKYERFLQDHFYRKYKGYAIHTWYRLPEDEEEILFYNRVAYECGHPEYMIEVPSTNSYSFAVQKSQETKETVGLSEKLSVEEQRVQDWLNRVVVPNGYKKMTVSEVIKRREYGSSLYQGITSNNYDNGVLEENTRWSSFYSSPYDYKHEYELITSIPHRYEIFLQDHFYRIHRGYMTHPWYKEPTKETEIMFYNRVAYECGHPEYMIKYNNIYTFTLPSKRPVIRMR